MLACVVDYFSRFDIVVQSERSVPYFRFRLTFIWNKARFIEGAEDNIGVQILNPDHIFEYKFFFFLAPVMDHISGRIIEVSLVDERMWIETDLVSDIGG